MQNAQIDEIFESAREASALKEFLDRIYRIQRADRFKPNFQEPGIYHEKGKFGKHEKLVTQYSMTFGRRFRRLVAWIAGNTRYAGIPMQSIVGNGKP